VLQRVAQPERLLRAVHDALAPGGRVVLSEFVDADPEAAPHRSEALHRYVRVLPIGLRFDPDTGRPFPRDLRPTEGHSKAPFDGLAAARAVFFPEALYRGGGGLLQPLLAPALVRNLRPEGLDEKLLGFLGASEHDLQARGLVADVFAIFVGRPRAASRMT
jgi:SAM-dependent methyltransferase